MGNGKQTKKTDNVIRVSWLEGCCYRVFYFRRSDAGELFDELTRLKRKKIDFCMKVKREEL